MANPLTASALHVVPESGEHPMLASLSSAIKARGEARLGIMGGTFDPVHMGHLACAEMAMDACRLDGVLFIVAPRPWMKRGKRMAAAEERLEMCCLATRGNPSFEVSAIEMGREGKTFTSETLRVLKEVLPEEVSLHFIIGADTLKTLPGWYEADALKDLASFVCVDRPGSEDYRRLLDDARRCGFDIEWVDAPLLEISSSEVRERASLGKSIRYLVSDEVVEYIGSHGLYKEAQDA